MNVPIVDEPFDITYCVNEELAQKEGTVPRALPQAFRTESIHGGKAGEHMYLRRPRFNIYTKCFQLLLNQSMQVSRDYDRSTTGEAASTGVYIVEIRHASKNASRIPLLRGQQAVFVE